ncbi:MAG: hypothetical protein NTZ98_12450, partial [Acidobacteria bacterium]|nr:hypothetical protein [Acidobacteriota bacterium]
GIHCDTTGRPQLGRGGRPPIPAVAFLTGARHGDYGARGLSQAVPCGPYEDGPEHQPGRARTEANGHQNLSANPAGSSWGDHRAGQRAASPRIPSGPSSSSLELPLWQPGLFGAREGLGRLISLTPYDADLAAINVKGFPLSYETFDGNRLDVTTLEVVLWTVERKYG